MLLNIRSSLMGAHKKATPMTSLWEKLTTEEKIEQLRGDLKSTITSVNMLIENQNRLGERLRALQAEVRERAKQNIILPVRRFSR